MSLHRRIAERLGWTERGAQSLSLPALRDIVEPLSEKLAYEIDLAMRRVTEDEKH